MLYSSDVVFVGNIGMKVGASLIALENNLYAADLSFAEKHGGIITRRALSLIKGALLEDVALGEIDASRHVHVDVRVSYLRPGQAQHNPHWHCDNWVKEEGPTRPPWDKPKQYLMHYGVCPTEFQEDHVNAPLPIGEVWPQPRGPVFLASPGVIYQYGHTQFHRSPPAKAEGFRYFIRVMQARSKPLNGNRGKAKKSYVMGLRDQKS